MFHLARIEKGPGGSVQNAQLIGDGLLWLAIGVKGDRLAIGLPVKCLVACCDQAGRVEAGDFLTVVPKLTYLPFQ